MTPAAIARARSLVAEVEATHGPLDDEARMDAVTLLLTAYRTLPPQTLEEVDDLFRACVAMAASAR